MRVMPWEEFFLEHHIPYVTSGPNIAKGNLGIKCPWCGKGDRSEHLGLNIANGKWGCWRNDDHRGSAPHRLVMKLLDIGFEQAKELIGGGSAVERADLFRDLVAQGDEFFNVAHEVERVNTAILEMPDNFRHLADHGLGLRFYNYLLRRDFHDPIQLGRDYDLRTCLSGRWKDRIIIPVYINGRLVNWTGRGIGNSVPLRYDTLSTNPKRVWNEGDPVALLRVTDTLLFYPELYQDRGRLLVVVEGPFDALKVDFYGKVDGVRATCLFTKNISKEQMHYLKTLRDKYDELVVVLDQKAEVDTIKMAGKLAHLGARYAMLPSNIDDPGKMTALQVREFFDESNPNGYKRGRDHTKGTGV